jgi:hypothetical protein
VVQLLWGGARRMWSKAGPSQSTKPYLKNKLKAKELEALPKW